MASQPCDATGGTGGVRGTARPYHDGTAVCRASAPGQTLSKSCPHCQVSFLGQSREVSAVLSL